MIKKIIIVISIILVTIIGIGYLFVNQLFNDLCGNEVFNELYSPDNSKKIIVFQRDCGATTGFSTQISILDGRESLNNTSGNIFTMKGHPSDSQVLLRWIDLKTIHIKYNKDYEVYKNEDQFHGVNILYN